MPQEIFVVVFPVGLHYHGNAHDTEGHQKDQCKHINVCHCSLTYHVEKMKSREKHTRTHAPPFIRSHDQSRVLKKTTLVGLNICQSKYIMIQQFKLQKIKIRRN